MIYVFDLDGTITDASHRLHYITSAGKKRNWKKFFEEIPLDPAFSAMVGLVKSLSRDNNSTTIMQTGRPEKYRPETTNWLAKYDLNNCYDALLMRPNGSHIRNVDQKLQFLEYIKDKYMPQNEYSDICWFEDAEPVVKSLNQLGVITLSCQHFVGSHDIRTDPNHPEIPYQDQNDESHSSN